MGYEGPGGVGQAHVHSASDDVMLSEIVRFWALQPLSNAFCAVFENSLPSKLGCYERLLV